MFENITKFLKKFNKKEENKIVRNNSKNAAKERLHLVLMQDRANVSADFLELMKQEIIEVIKKYIDVDESAIDVRLTNKENEDGTNGAPALYANIPIVNIKNDARKVELKKSDSEEQEKSKEKKSDLDNIEKDEEVDLENNENEEKLDLEDNEEDKEEKLDLNNDEEDEDNEEKLDLEDNKEDEEENLDLDSNNKSLEENNVDVDKKNKDESVKKE